MFCLPKHHFFVDLCDDHEWSTNLRHLTVAEPSLQRRIVSFYQLDTLEGLLSFALAPGAAGRVLQQLNRSQHDLLGHFPVRNPQLDLNPLRMVVVSVRFCFLYALAGKDHWLVRCSHRLLSWNAFNIICVTFCWIFLGWKHFLIHQLNCCYVVTLARHYFQYWCITSQRRWPFKHSASSLVSSGTGWNAFARVFRFSFCLFRAQSVYTCYHMLMPLCSLMLTR